MNAKERSKASAKTVGRKNVALKLAEIEINRWRHLSCVTSNERRECG